MNGAATIILVAALLALSGLAVAILTGLKPAVVKTGSMRPMLAPGTLILVKPTLAEDLKVKDVITFTDPDMPAKGLVTHRIVKIDHVKGRPVITTQGDANPVPDTWKLKLKKDAGLMKFEVPAVGHLSFLVRSKKGYMLLLGIPVLLLSLSALMKIWGPMPEPETAAPEDESQAEKEPDAFAPVVMPRYGYPRVVPDAQPDDGPQVEEPPGIRQEARSA